MASYKVMFICSGNICRSPLAHAVFEDMVRGEELDDTIRVESSGTGSWHVGEPADSRMRRTSADHGVTITHRARHLHRRDISDYDLLLTMDAHNYRDAHALCRSDTEREKVRMFRDFDPRGPGDVPDPWYGGMEGFETVWDIVERTCRSLLDDVRRRIAA